MTTTLTNIVSLASDAALCAPVEALSLHEQVQAHVVITALAEASEARLSALKASLMIYTGAKGALTGDNGTRALEIEGSKVTVEHRTGKMPDLDGMIALLATKGIAVGEATDVVSTLVLNPSKVEFLVQTGKVTQAEVDSLRPRVPALRIYASKALKALCAPFKALAGKGEK